MFNFEELLNQKLPSQLNTPEGSEVLESAEDDINSENPVKTEDSIDDDIAADLNAIELDGLDDGDIDDISEDDLAAVADADEEELTDDEEVEADETMALCATPVLLNKEVMEAVMAEQLILEFPTVVAEGFLLESDLDQFLDTDTDDLFQEARVFAAKTRVQLDEKDRRKQLFEIGVQASARAHNDPTYWKLQKCYKLERMYKAKLRQKYRAEALKRVKAYVKKLKSSGSKVLANLGAKITGQK